MDKQHHISCWDLCMAFPGKRRLFGRKPSIEEQSFVLRNVDLEISYGESVGLIGSNGSGKSTLIKVVAGLLRPTQGEMRVSGLIPTRNRIKHVANIGCVFGQKSQLFWDITVKDNLEILRRIYRVSKKDFRQNLDEIVDLLQLDDFWGREVRLLSLGQRMRSEFAASVIHSPQLLILDEPTIGLDEKTKKRILDFLKARGKQSALTLLMTSHDPQDIDAVCDKVVRIADGRLQQVDCYANVLDSLTDSTIIRVDFEKAPPSKDIDIRFPVVDRRGNTLLFLVPRRYEVRDFVAESNILERFSVTGLSVHSDRSKSLNYTPTSLE